VAILNKGWLVAQAPIEELLKGNQGVFEIKLKGMTTDIYAKVSNLSWVNSIQQNHSRDNETWHVSVNDQELAEDQLLRLILSDKRIKVIHFGQNVVELEDIFLSLMEDA